MSGSANYNSPNLVIPYVMPGNIPPAQQYLFQPIYIALQNLVQSLIYYCGISPRAPATILSSNNDPTAILANNVHRFYTQCVSGETIVQGAAINLTAVDGILQVQNANATDNTKPCHGFCSQSGGIAPGTVGEVILNDGVIIGNLSGLTPGTQYYLSTTDGEYTSTPPTASGNLQQLLGIAITATTFRFWTGAQIQH